MYANIFCDAGQVPILRYFEACEWPHFLTSLFENTHIFAQIFSSETKIEKFICKLCLQTAKRVYKNQKTVFEYVNILFNQVYE